jgi:hypothetical protein
MDGAEASMIIGIAIAIYLIVAAFAESPGRLPFSGGGDVVNWSELAAMFGILGGIVGVIQWVVVRVLMDPLIRNNTEAVKTWAVTTFPTAQQFQAHEEKDKIHQEHIAAELEKLWSRTERKN